ncbi:PAS domain S-box protein [Xylophilus sp.]|uniref:PAS domain S-box protein n=1 Tax=Xylophilus sp. TaxID=2653893 RepID=UPI0013BC3E6D|nr:PAS domain S-box protein [Xylophilus sp.]KAF1049006.1 MAG: Sensory/regulatory protein RpfC [Xylophilus sp.]
MHHLSDRFVPPGAPGPWLAGSYAPALVLLSIGVAVFASVLALHEAGLARRAPTPARREAAIAAGAFSLGIGIWSMHFIGMLAFDLGVHVHYDGPGTALSLLPSLAASWVALRVAAGGTLGTARLVLAGVLVGAGVGAMHYSGMLAMRMQPELRYDVRWFALSIAVAAGLAALALRVQQALEHRRVRRGLAPLAGGTVMGLSVAGMHYCGMAAARFGGMAEMDYDLGIQNLDALALSVALVAVTTTLVVFAFNALLRYRALFLRVRASEASLRAVVDTAQDGIITFDGEGRIQGFNHAAERMFGWTAPEAAGRNLRELLLGGARPDAGAAAPWQQAITDGQALQAVRRDGTTLPVRFAVGRAEVDGRQLYVGCATDLSAERAMEQALRDREQQYRSLIRNIPGTAFRALPDEHRTMLFVSEAVEAMTGWPAAGFMGGQRRFADLIHPDDAGRVREEVRRSVDGDRSYEVEYRLHHADGRERWVWEGGSAVRAGDGRTLWLDGVILDITDAKLRHAEYEGKVHATSRAMAVVEFDLHGRVLAANDNFLQIMGYSLDEVWGRHHEIFCDPRAVPHGESAAMWQRLGRGEFEAGDFQRRAKGGRPVWLQATYNPIFGADGRPFKVAMLASDISERHAMEEALREAKDRAELAAASKTTFLANMSHEIRTPMNSILGFTELLLGTALEARQRRHVETVHHSARTLLALLNDILDTAKLERGAMELELLDFSLRALCEQVIASLSITARNKGLSLALEYDEALGDVFRGDALRIQQILTNLLGNGVKFTERGGVRLEVRPAAGGGVDFAVHDSGIGIAADRIGRIFEPFAQADASMSRRFGGTGLGTTIALQLTERMGGAIRVDSAVGVGSTFRVFLPLEAGAPLPQAAGPLTTAALRPLTILVADDVPQNVELLSIALGRGGHTVVVATDGLQAVELFKTQPVDVVLMDVHMPLLDGLAAARRMRLFEREQGRRPLPIVALTASVLERDRRAAREAGMDGFASKPVETARLLAEIARVTGALAPGGPPAGPEPMDMPPSPPPPEGGAVAID